MSGFHLYAAICLVASLYFGTHGDAISTIFTSIGFAGFLFMALQQEGGE